MISAVIFDLDDTLYSENTYFFEVFKNHPVTSSSILDIKKMFEDGIKENSVDVIGAVLQNLNIYSEELQNEIFEIYKNCNASIKLNPDVKSLLSSMRERGIKLGIITNGVVAAQRNKVRLLQLDNLVDIIIFAREEGKEKEKPHPDSFQKVCEYLNVERKNCIFIGDNIHNDVNGARNFGMNAIHFTKYISNGCNETASFDSFEMLTQYLDEIKK